jgi:polysaccharide deacetylase 2 family uncharacterized protein YibQ
VKRGQGGLIAALALAAVLVFVAGEIYLFSHSESGSYFLARNGIYFRQKPVAESLSQTIRAKLRQIGVPLGAQYAEPVREAGGTVVHWKVLLPPRASLFFVNAALSEAFETRGARVFDAWEDPPGDQGERVRMRLGVGKWVTHEVLLVRSADVGEKEVVRLALVLEGFARAGSDTLAETALTLPFPYSGAVLTNGRNAKRWAESIARADREVVAQLPMEPMNFPARSPGPEAILVDMTRGQIRRQVKKNLNAAPGCVAALPYMGGMALQDQNAMQAVAQELKEAKLAYVEVAGEERSVGLDAAAAAGVPFLRLDGRIEPGRGSDAAVTKTVRAELRGLVDTARRRGFASCVIRLDPALLRVLRREVPALERQGVRLVPLSSLLRPSVY